MVWMDIDMPECCAKCEFAADYSEGCYGCALVTDDNDYGLMLIERPDIRHEKCPLMSTDDSIIYILRKHSDDLRLVRDDIDRQLIVIEKYIGKKGGLAPREDPKKSEIDPRRWRR